MTQKLPSPEDFIISVEIGCADNLAQGVAYHVVEIDLSQIEFESQVLAAAGRFRSLRRKTRGGQAPKAVICAECGDRLPRTSDLADHRREKHGE